MSNKNFNYFYVEVDKCSQLAFIGHEKLVSCVEEEFWALNPGGTWGKRVFAPLSVSISEARMKWD